MLDLGIVIVTWNIRELIQEALSSLIDDLAQAELRYRIIVVDSASSDGTPDLVATYFPDVHLITSPDNLGFGKANNLGLRTLGFGESQHSQTLPQAVYLLNPDTITQAGATRSLYDALMAAPDVGLVGARLSYGDGSFQHSAFMFPGLRQLWVEFFPTPGRLVEGGFNGRYHRALYDNATPFAVDFPLGATMMLRREVVEQTGMFDEDFFMYCEEIDWAWRIHRAGWRVMCVPHAHVIHLSGQSTGQVRATSLRYLWESRLRLIDRYYPMWKKFLARLLIRQGMQERLKALPSLSTYSTEQKQELSEVYNHIIALTRE